jgi:hypothetical protein
MRKSSGRKLKVPKMGTPRIRRMACFRCAGLYAQFLIEAVASLSEQRQRNELIPAEPAEEEVPAPPWPHRRRTCAARTRPIR